MLLQTFHSKPKNKTSQIVNSKDLYRVSKKKKNLTLGKLLFNFKFSYQRNIVVHILKEYFIPDHLVPFLCDLCLRLGDQEALFVRV